MNPKKSDIFEKSDTGAQSSWKGFSSQTLYIANRLVTDKTGYDFYPEDIEDLVIRFDKKIIEAVQIKNITADLTLSHLALSKTSQGGEGFFQRVCKLHKEDTDFNTVRVVCFGSIGKELLSLQKGIESVRKNVKKKLCENHTLLPDEAEWLIDALTFETVSEDELIEEIQRQILECVPVMAAPDLTQSLLIYYISNLSKTKGKTNLASWKEEIHKIGTHIAEIDGYYKHYGKSLIRLSELQLNKDIDQLKDDFKQGASGHPSFIRNKLDVIRNQWLSEIKQSLSKDIPTIVKGASGQGKSVLCYRYLINSFPEQLVFCVQSLYSEKQMIELVVAVQMLCNYMQEFALYIDVKPGEQLWYRFLQELQQRGVRIPVLLSIRNEDYNATIYTGDIVHYQTIELLLTEEEARTIFEHYNQPHPQFRTFEEAWTAFREKGPLIEYMYLLSNNETLVQRIHAQIQKLLSERIKDSWFELLAAVSFAGKLGYSIKLESIKQALSCDNIQAAINRLKDEYLIRISEEGNMLESLHQVRAKTIFDVLTQEHIIDSKKNLIAVIKSVSDNSISNILMEYFSNNVITDEDILLISQNHFYSWIGYGNAIMAFLWLDTKNYVENNAKYILSLVQEYGQGWRALLPADLTGYYDNKQSLFEELLKNPGMNLDKDKMLQKIEEVKTSLHPVQIESKYLDLFLKNSCIPNHQPFSDREKSLFGYSLFWLAKRDVLIDLDFNKEQLVHVIIEGDIQSDADLIRGLYEQKNLIDFYESVINPFLQYFIVNYNIIWFEELDDKIICKFVPPFYENKLSEQQGNNYNDYWRKKVLYVLQQVYPEKEYIDIELIGVDVLEDIGIKALDNKLCIHKTNRYDYWIVELNSWVKNRVDYMQRPTSWNEFITHIDQARKKADSINVELLKVIDDVYKKGHSSDGRVNTIKTLLNDFSANKRLENNLLPCYLVDSYCQYSETNRTIVEKHLWDIISPRLAFVEPYKKLLKNYTETFDSLNNFYSQFYTVLLLRSKKQSIDEEKNTRLSIFNLFNAAKNLGRFQKEYNVLFRDYTSCDNDFCQQEFEHVLTLLNTWHEVINRIPHGFAISYDAKQKIKQDLNYCNKILEKLHADNSFEIIETEEQIYLLHENNIAEEDSLEKSKIYILSRLRDVFQDAIPYTSCRCFIENHYKELLYVPLYNGTSSLIAFSIPLFKILDMEIGDSSIVFYPSDISDSIRNNFVINKRTNKQWCEFVKVFSTIALLLKICSKIQQISFCSICSNGWSSIVKNTVDKVRDLQDKGSGVMKYIDLLLINNPNSALYLKVRELFNNINNLVMINEKNYHEIDFNDYINKANELVGLMVLLHMDIIHNIPN